MDGRMSGEREDYENRIEKLEKQVEEWKECKSMYQMQCGELTGDLMKAKEENRQLKKELYAGPQAV